MKNFLRRPGRGAAEPRRVEVTSEVIRLGQFLKLADLVDQGSEAKAVIAAGDVQVNGIVELRRGRQLACGDVVELGGQTVVLVEPGEGSTINW